MSSTLSPTLTSFKPVSLYISTADRMIINRTSYTTLWYNQTYQKLHISNTAIHSNECGEGSFESTLPSFVHRVHWWMPCSSNHRTLQTFYISNTPSLHKVSGCSKSCVTKGGWGMQAVMCYNAMSIHGLIQSQGYLRTETCILHFWTLTASKLSYSGMTDR